MPRGKISERATAIVQQGDAAVRPSKIPSLLRFPLLVVLSLTLSTMLYSFTADYTAADLARVSRSLDRWWEVGALVGWRTIELGLGWFGNYDAYDLGALSLLSHGPPLYLLGAFYEVRPITILVSLTIDSLSSFLPFRLLRPLSLAHSASHSRQHSANVPNKEILASTSIQAYATILAAGIYAVTIYVAYVSYLPVYLVTFFSNIPTITAAHSATPISLFPITILLGLAAESFIFAPALAAVPSLADAKKAPFNPETATLGETFWYNIWGYSTETKVTVQRTVALMLVSGINTFLQTLTIEGVEARGAIGYSAVWVVASGLAGTALGIVGAI